MKRGVFLLGFSFLVSKVLGLLRDHLLASGFGAGNSVAVSFNLDTYYAAFRLPDLLFNLLAYGVLSAAFIPLFTELLKKEGKEHAFRFANQILQTVAFIVTCLAIILFIITPFIVPLYVPWFSPEKQAVTVTLTRMMLLTPLFFTVGSITAGMQNVFHRYFGLAFGPVLYNLGIILGIVLLGNRYGVYGVGIGVIAGALLNFLIQLPGIWRIGFRFTSVSVWWTRQVKEMLLLSIPRIFGMSVTQLSLFIGTIIASGLAEGSITLMNLASNLTSLPLGVIGISIATVSFSRLASVAVESNMQHFIIEIKTNIQRMLFLLIPVIGGMLALRLQIVRLFLGRGKFDWDDTTLTANTLGILLLGVIFEALIFLLARGFYALKNTRTPVFIGIGAVTINIATSIIATKIFPLGIYGIAIGTAAAHTVNALLLFIFLWKKVGGSLLDYLEIVKFIVSGVLMLFIVQATKMSFGFIFEDIDTYKELIIQTGAAVAAGAITYLGLCSLFRCKDMKSVKEVLTAPFARQASPSGQTSPSEKVSPK